MPAMHSARNDFNGDGRSDILWRDDNGVLTNWLATANGGFTPNWSGFNHTLNPNFSVLGTGDFNGDGRNDILIGSNNGLLITWLKTISSGFQPDWENATIVSSDWRVVGTADFNGDGHTDILWRNKNGQIMSWLTSDGAKIVDVPSASFVPNAPIEVPNNWRIEAVGDFNGDGMGDILWRHDSGVIATWVGQANGSFTNNYSNSVAAVPLDWHIEGVGDFNGDGKNDILWRNDSGVAIDWLGLANGGFVENYANSAAGAPADWHVSQIGDFNGDGRDDILWRHDTGVIANWLGQSNGGFINNYSNSAVEAPLNWHVQAPDLV